MTHREWLDLLESAEAHRARTAGQPREVTFVLPAAAAEALGVTTPLTVSSDSEEARRVMAWIRRQPPMPGFLRAKG